MTARRREVLALVLVLASSLLPGYRHLKESSPLLYVNLAVVVGVAGLLAFRLFQWSRRPARGERVVRPWPTSRRGWIAFTTMVGVVLAGSWVVQGGGVTGAIVCAAVVAPAIALLTLRVRQHLERGEADGDDWGLDIGRDDGDALTRRRESPHPPS